MIELPEAMTLACQMTAELAGTPIRSGMRGNSPHKFAFYTRSPEEYASILQGRTFGATKAHGSFIVTAIEPGYSLVLGGGGERIRLHNGAETLPAKHQLLVEFEDDRYLSVTVQGWGSVQLYSDEQMAHPFWQSPGALPINDRFTFEYFDGLFASLEPEDKRAVKFFAISKPGILGVGNGYLQDILFRARLHPRRRAVSLSASERRAFYDATRETIRLAVDADGRDTEFDLYNAPGKYVRLLDSRTVGKPCPECGSAIQKIAFLGGASYFCPICQAL